ncbi:MAG TPA: glycerate kinase [Candidatus Nanopelagicales bacterium]
MKVVICPDSFTGTLSAAEAAAAMADGWRGVAPHDLLVLRPLSDGGPGFLAAIEAGRGGRRHVVDVLGPLGQPVHAEYLVDDAGTAWVESAAATGLHLVPPEQRDPTRTSTFGLGQVLASALAEDPVRIVVGVGGTGTCDGGAGMLAALGARSRPAGVLTGGGGGLAGLRSLDLEPALAAVGTRVLEVATDVDVPLLGARGAARGFAPQKGASVEQVEQLEAAMGRWGQLLGRGADGRSAALALGAGAGGGLGAALLRLGARRVPGIETVLAATDLTGALADADVVLTGEGAFDWQSLRGKVVAGVAAAATTRAIPTVVLAGRVEVSRREWITAGVAAVFAAAPEPGQTAAQGVAAAAARAARTWARR